LLVLWSAALDPPATVPLITDVVEVGVALSAAAGAVGLDELPHAAAAKV